MWKYRNLLLGVERLRLVASCCGDQKQSDLSAMNWRRGLLLAAIHLVIAGTLLAWNESEYWRYLKSEGLGPSHAHFVVVAFQEDQSISFRPCNEGVFIDDWFSPSFRVGGLANLPVALITGWHTPCTTPSYLGSIVESRFHRTRISEVLNIVILCILVSIEWLLVGGFPLIRIRFWWLEPGVFITICTLVGTALAVIPRTASVSVVPASVAELAWLWWVSLLVWTGLRSGWRMVKRSRLPAA